MSDAPFSLAAPPAGKSPRNDIELVASWALSLPSDHSRRNCWATGVRFLHALPLGMGLRRVKIVQLREALTVITAGLSDSSARQYTLRIKSLLGYAHRRGYMELRAGAALKLTSAPPPGSLPKRFLSEIDIKRLIKGADPNRDHLLLSVTYAGGLRVSEVVRLSWGNVMRRKTAVWVSINGKAGAVRQVQLPNHLGARLVKLRGDARSNDPVFPSRLGKALTERAVHAIVKQAARSAGIKDAVSPHWLRLSHAFHAIERGASASQVAATLGYRKKALANGYRLMESSGLYLDVKIFSGV